MSTAAARTQSNPSATLTYGANQETFEIPEGGITVKGVIERFANAMGLPGEGENRDVNVNGNPASGDTPINDGDEVEVVRKAGDKG